MMVDPQALQHSPRTCIGRVLESLIVRCARRRIAFPELPPTALTEAVKHGDLLREEAPHPMRLGVFQVAPEAPAREAHGVIGLLIEVEIAEACGAAEAGEAHGRIPGEVAQDLLVPARL